MSSQRFIEIDLARSLAIIGMIIYHTAYDLHMLYGWQIDIFSGEWKLFQLSIASLFLLVVGVSAAIADARVINTDSQSTWIRAWKRFVRIGMAALLVTITTYMIDSETYVRFGILHVIATSAFLLPAITSWTYRRSLLMIIMPLIGIFILGISMFIDQWHMNGYWRILGIPLGIRPEHFTTVDYFPLIPWFGVLLLGYVIGYAAYVQYPEWRRTDVQCERLCYAMKIVLTCGAIPGRYSLLLYLMHQPIIIGILSVLLGTPRL